jgi:hypothetical protein
MLTPFVTALVVGNCVAGLCLVGSVALVCGVDRYSDRKTQAVTMLRQVTGRYASRFTPGGREKRVTRPIPSLPKLKCLEGSESKEDSREPAGSRLSHQGP